MKGINQNGNLDLAVRWSNKPAAYRRIRDTGLVPLHGRPKQFREHGGSVALIGSGNKVKMTLRSLAVKGPRKVVLADGKPWAKGYVIRADKRSIRVPKPLVTSPVAGFPAVGAFKYFDDLSGKAVLVGPQHKWHWKHAGELNSSKNHISFRPHDHGIPGRPRNHPESILVDQYARFIGEEARFGHSYLRVPKLFVDLFDLTHWQLIEAKADTARETVRMAIGQLQDYRRFFPRRPTLAVLLPERPSPSCIELLTDNRIRVIWRTRRGNFSMRAWQTD